MSVDYMDCETQIQPRIVYVENDPFDAELAAIEFSVHGIQIIIARSITEGEAILTNLGVVSHHPMIALLDIKMPTPYHKNLESHVLASVLQRRIQQGILPPLWLVAITAYLTPRCVDEAHFAGFHTIIEKPLTTQHVQMLCDMLQQPPKQTQDVDNVGHELYQLKAQEVLDLIHKATPPTRYTTEDIHILLSTVTHYPPPTHVNEGRLAGLLISLGGPDEVRKLFSQWCTTQPVDSIHAHLLRELIANNDPREKLQHAAHRSTIFRNMRSLPKIVAQTFRSTYDEIS